MKKVFIYCDKESSHAESQRFADSKGWHVARIFHDAHELLQLVGGNLEIHTLIVNSMNCIKDDMVLSEIFYRDCARKKVEVYVASLASLVLSSVDPQRLLVREILEKLVEWDNRHTVRKLAAGRKAKSEKTGLPCGGASPDRYGDRGGVAQKNAERRVIGQIIHWGRSGYNFSGIARILTCKRIQIPHPEFVHRKGSPARTPFFWTRELVRGLFNNWVNTGSILPFIGNNL